jgi:8-oxo-dGTP pyrophosphatase MutT (NUDIX family)
MSDPHREYVAGFLFRQRTPTLKQVLLVRKNHPEWQKNMLNGVGGELEGREIPGEAMIREFREEAHYMTNKWEFFAREMGPGYTVHFFRHTLDPEFEKKKPYEAPAKNDVGEELEWHDANGIKSPVIGNLNWLIPLALDPRRIECYIDTNGDIRKIVTW